ncbi:ABC transporter permease [Roseomonas sp. E05]|uniref:ABC transporter permease n=1 Tax=Roseomonas sp. E05 TaxID=3046310 RepID=UPI0024B948AA|nr:ABC transporter permease [Roseomonas sp. E05]MDJ0388318.1 ABC transporter permease [Roseomonas sp. E05]
MSAPMGDVPRWAELALLPVLNLLLALALTALLVLATGGDPVAALTALAVGSLGSADALGYTLYYATNMAFTGLAVAVAFQGGLFNIGAEGQAYLAGLGVTLAALHLGFLPAALLVPLAIAGGAAFGAAWAAIPGWLQARRGSHIVITTIMFNFLAAALMVHLIVNLLTAPGSMAPESPPFPEAASLPGLAQLGFPSSAPVNLALGLAVLAALGVWLLVWRTPWGYALRVMGQSPAVASYAGIDQGRMIILVMALSGALAGGVAVNELLGAQHKLLLGFTSGYGFTGIAVALMGRNHPAGVLLAALLFGALTQGGAELAFEVPDVPSEIVVLIQGLVILFTGALGNMLRPALARVLGRAGG